MFVSQLTFQMCKKLQNKRPFRYSSDAYIAD